MKALFIGFCKLRDHGALDRTNSDLPQDSRGAAADWQEQLWTEGPQGSPTKGCGLRRATAGASPSVTTATVRPENHIRYVMATQQPPKLREWVRFLHRVPWAVERFAASPGNRPALHCRVWRWDAGRSVKPTPLASEVRFLDSALYPRQGGTRPDWFTSLIKTRRSMAPEYGRGCYPPRSLSFRGGHSRFVQLAGRMTLNHLIEVRTLDLEQAGLTPVRIRAPIPSVSAHVWKRLV